MYACRSGTDGLKTVKQWYVKKNLAVLSPFALYQVIKLFRLSTAHTYSTFRFSFIGETTMWIYYNMTIGIKDESVFIPPKMCFKNASIVLCGIFLKIFVAYICKMWHKLFVDFSFILICFRDPWQENCSNFLIIDHLLSLVLYMETKFWNTV